MFKDIQNKVSGVFGHKFDIAAEVRLLSEEVRTIAEIQEMAETAGYKKYKQWTIDKVSLYRDQIVKLAVDVDKNKKEITEKYWLCEFLESQIRAVDLCLALEPDKARKLKHLDGLVHEAGLDLEIIGG